MIKLIKSSFYNEKKTKRALISFIKKAKIFSMNDECARYEIEFAKKQQRKHAVFVSSGSMANLVVLQALLNRGDLKVGDNVGVSALTWATNIMPIIQLGLKPVIMDCSIENLNVTAETVIETLKKYKLKAFFITHVLGFCADIAKIKKICDQEKIILLEDTCESLGSKAEGKLLGNFGLASTFSSFVGHHFSTIEGGMICTDDSELHEYLVMARAHGWDRNLTPKQQAAWRKKYNIDEFYSKYTFYDLAYNARPTEIQGFIGKTTIGYWNTIVKKREGHFKKLHKATLENPDILPLKVGHMDVVSNFAMPVVFKSKELWKLYRTRFEKAKVEIRPIIAGNMSKQPFFTKRVAKGQSCPGAAFAHENGFYFGNNPELTKKEVQQLCTLLKK